MLRYILSAVGVTALVAVTACHRGPTPATPPPGATPLAVGSNSRFSHTLEVAAPAERIWALWTDVAGWPRWDTELRSAAAPQPLTEGSEGRLQPREGRASRFRVTQFTPGERYTFETDLPGAALRITRTLTATPTGTRFTHDVQFTGPLGRLFAARYGPQFRRALPQAMQRLADLAGGQP